MHKVKETEIMKIVILYRYISLAITSAFYFLYGEGYAIQRKIFIVACIGISSVLLNYLYIHSHKRTYNIKLLVFIEIIANIVILIPSGGLNSPYVWYSLNTIIITSIELEKKYCWGNLFIYLFTAVMATYLIHYRQAPDVLEFLKGESDIILSLVMITFAIQLLSKYAGQIEKEGEKLFEANSRLLTSNKAMWDSMNYVLELYQAIHLLISQNDKDELIKLVVRYTKKIIKTNNVLFYKLEKYNSSVIATNELKDDIKNQLINRAIELKEHAVNLETPFKIIIENRCFILMFIKSNYKVYGGLGIELPSEQQNFGYIDYADHLKFLSSLSAVIFERFELEQVNERLLINEEQNRIANEIHDSVLQRLFSISCGIFTLMKRQGQDSGIEIHKELSLIRDSLNEAMEELRSTIYGLSWRKNGVNNFITDIEHYISEIKALHNINIHFSCIGHSEFLTALQKKAFYRMICEGVGNAVRHGGADDIQIILKIHADHTRLYITDNGTGFSMEKMKEEHKEGLGLRNIHYLAQSLNGMAKVDSQMGKGTKIKVITPNTNKGLREEVI